MVRILLIDYHRLLYSRIDAILSVDKDMALVDVVDNWDTLQKTCLQHQPDAVLLALDIANSSGLDVCTYLQENHPTIKIIVLLNDPDNTHMQQLLQLNMPGTMLKSDVANYLVEAITAVVQGKSWVSPTLLPTLLRLQAERQEEKLTKRELAVLQLLLEEKTDKEIGLVLNLAERTVRCYLSNIYAKLGVHTWVGAAVEAVKRNLI